MGALTPEVVTTALRDKDAKVRATGVRIADRTLAAELAKLVKDPAIEVQSALGFAISAWPESQAATVELAGRAGKDPLVRDAILSGLRGRELDVLEAIA